MERNTKNQDRILSNLGFGIFLFFCLLTMGLLLLMLLPTLGISIVIEVLVLLFGTSIISIIFFYFI